MKRILLVSILFVLLAFGLLQEAQASSSASPQQQPPHPPREMHTVVAEARFAGSGPYHEVVRVKGVPTAEFPGPGIWQVDVYINVKWGVEVHINKLEENSVAWGHVEAQIKYYDKVIKFIDTTGSPIKKNYLRIEQQSFHFTRSFDTEKEGGPDLSFCVVAGGGGFHGGSFSSYAFIVAQITYEFTLLEPKGQPELSKVKEINGEAEEWLEDHREELEKRLGVQIPGDHGCVIGRITWDPEQPCVGEPVYFAVQRSEKPASVRWSFGDGTISNQEFAVHVYGDPGDYKLRAIIRCKDGSEHTRTVNLHITPCRMPRPAPEKLKEYAKILSFHVKNLSYQQYLVLKKRYYKIHWATETAKAIADTVFALMGRPPKPETVRKAIWLGTKYTVSSGLTIAAAATHKPELEWLQKLWEHALQLNKKVVLKIAKEKAEKIIGSLKDIVYDLSDYYDKQSLDAINALADQANDPPASDYMESCRLQTPSLVILRDETELSAVELAAVTITNCQSWQNVIEEAFVESFERYQKAVMVGDTAGIELQATCLRRYALHALENLSTLLHAINVATSWITEHEDSIAQNLNEVRKQISSETIKREEALVKFSMDEVTILIAWTYTVKPENLMDSLNVLRNIGEEKMEMYSDILRHIARIYPDSTVGISGSH